jgi:hypothetical protein
MLPALELVEVREMTVNGDVVLAVCTAVVVAAIDARLVCIAELRLVAVALTLVDGAIA